LGGDAIDEIPHFNGTIQKGNVPLKDRGTVGLGKNRFGKIPAYLSFVHIEGGYELNIAGSIAAEVLCDQTGNVSFWVLIIVTSLHKGAGAVSHANNGSSNLLHIRTSPPQ
jgi:hypothetical protein